MLPARTGQGQSPALLGPVWCPTGASPGRKVLTLNLSCFVLEGVPHSAFLGLLCSLILKFASLLRVSLANISMLSIAKCLFSKSREQEQPQCGRRWKPYLAGTGLIEPLRFKNPQNVLFFTKLNTFPGVSVRVLFSGSHLPSAVPPVPHALSPASPSVAPIKAGRGGGGSGWAPSHSRQPEAGGSVTKQEGQHPSGSRPPAPTAPRTSFNTGHTNYVLPSHIGFNIC